LLSRLEAFEFERILNVNDDLEKHSLLFMRLGRKRGEEERGGKKATCFPKKSE